jgi:3-oxoacyl-[acyl-carrier protein] reductase
MGEKVAVITGTSKGIGKGVAEHFLSKGYTVYGCSRGESAVCAENYRHEILDVKDEDAVRIWVRKIKNIGGRIDVLMCNAGYAPANFLASMTTGKVLEEVLRVNVMGTCFISREASKVMMKQKSGRIITVSSMAASLHLEGTSAYALSKSAIVEFTKILAKELAPFNITCNVIAPSMYMTDGVEALQDKVIERALEALTIKRKLALKELLHVIDFYVSENSSAITGQVISMGLVN